MFFCFCEWVVNYGDKIKVCRKGVVVGWKIIGEVRGREGRVRKKGGNLIFGKFSYILIFFFYSVIVVFFMEEIFLVFRE